MIKELSNKIRNIGKMKMIFLVYALIIFLSSILLHSSITQNDIGNEEVTYINALFLSASAFSDTGLTALPVNRYWNVWGQAIVAILILVGGFGFFAIKIYIFNFLFNRKFSTFSRSLVMAERGGINVGTTRKTVIVSLSALFAFILLGSIVLTIFFYTCTGNFQDNKQLDNPHHNFIMSLRFGIFHTISAINNAGFDIIGSSSIQPYYHNYFLQIFLALLFFVGGVGYPVIYDVYMKILRYKQKKKHRFSLFSRISLVTYFCVSILGFLVVYLTELINQNGFFSKSDDLGGHMTRAFAILFNVLSTRSAGFSTINMNQLLSSSKIVMAILMFIGAAPFSTAGGLRTTTLAIMTMTIIARIRGRNSIDIFKRRISDTTIQQATSAFCLAVFLIAVSVIIMQTINEISGVSDYRDSADVLFEVCSAFGTVGLSTGLVNIMDTSGKIVLIVLMFIGQLGLSSTLFLIKKNRSLIVSFPTSDIPIA